MSKPGSTDSPCGHYHPGPGQHPQGLSCSCFRHYGLAFAGGMYVFPGAGWRRRPPPCLRPYRTGPSEPSNQLDAIGHEWRGFWIAAIGKPSSGVLLATTILASWSPRGETSALRPIAR